MIKRYGIEGELIYQKDDGHIVRYEDYEILQQKFGGVSSLCEEAMRINCEWEKSMMAAICEDGIGSVTKAIEQLKADNHALQQKQDAMAAENAALKQVFVTKEFSTEVTDVFSDTAVLKIDGDEHHCHQWVDNDSDVIRAVLTSIKSENPTPATDAYLNSVRAEGVEILTSMLQQLIDDGSFDAKEIGVAAGAVHEGAQIAASLRSGTHDTADKAGAK